MCDISNNDIDIKKIKQRLANIKHYYKFDKQISDIVSSKLYTPYEKLKQAKEYIKEKKQKEGIKISKNNDETFDMSQYSEIIPCKVTREEVKLLLKKMTSEVTYEKRKEHTKKAYRTNPEYKASLKLIHYKNHMILYPEVKSIIENSDITKVEKLEQVRAFLKSLKQNKEK